MAEAAKSSAVVALRAKALTLLEKVKDVPLLLLRLNMGVLFASTGWGKVHNVEKVTAFFAELKIPAPHFQAITAKLSSIHGVADLATTDEFTYLLVLLAIAVLGPGRISIDRFVEKKLEA